MVARYGRDRKMTRKTASQTVITDVKMSQRQCTYDRTSWSKNLKKGKSWTIENSVAKRRGHWRERVNKSKSEKRCRNAVNTKPNCDTNRIDSHTNHIDRKQSTIKCKCTQNVIIASIIIIHFIFLGNYTACVLFLNNWRNEMRSRQTNWLRRTVVHTKRAHQKLLLLLYVCSKGKQMPHVPIGYSRSNLLVNWNGKRRWPSI